MADASDAMRGEALAGHVSEALLVRDVGEFGLIALLEDALPASARGGGGLVAGIGDDAAIWRPSEGADVVVTTDSLVEEVHFRQEWTDWESLGHKSLAVNISDLAAMGAAPRLAVVTLGLRGDERVVDLLALYRGIGELASRFGMAIAGGDIVRSPTALVLHVTALGEVVPGRALTRSGARAGDVIGVTGTLGASAAGFALLAMDPGDMRRSAQTADLLRQAHVRPEPRVALGRVLRHHGATAAMDLSDGLMGDLPKILSASNVSAEVDPGRVPVAAAVRALFPEDWQAMALRGGEDYELLFTAPPDAWSAIDQAATAMGGSVSQIGAILPKRDSEPSLFLVAEDGHRQPVAAGAFDHFVLATDTQPSAGSD